MSLEIWCPVEEFANLGGLSEWDCEQVTWSDRGVTFAELSFREAQEYTVALLHGSCGLRVDIIEPNRNANLNSFERRIDGPGGVLARHWLPGAPSRCHESLRGEWDGSETRIDQRILNHVTLHEILHGLGLGHYNGSDSVMNPRLNMSTYGTIDGWTADQLVRRYGKPSIPVPPIPPPTDDRCRKLFGVLQDFFTNLDEHH